MPIPMITHPEIEVGEHAAIVSASKIHMLDLEAVKQRLGHKWNRMSDLVHRYFEAAIRREMSPGDTFCSSGELSYLILFRDLTIAEARLKCAVVVEDVCKKLFGAQMEEISIRNLVAPVDLADLTETGVPQRVDSTLEREGQETLFSSQSGMQRSELDTLEVEITPPKPITHTISVGKPSFLFRPLWDAARSATLTYICQLLPETVRSDAVSTVPFFASNPENQIDLDVLCLQECLRRTANLRQAGRRVLLAVPIHFSTLCRPKKWSRYRAICEAVSAELFRDLAFILYGFENGVPHIRLVQELPKLTRRKSQVFCLVDNAEAAGIRFRDVGAHAIGMVLQPGAPDSSWIERVRSLSRDAQGGLDVFVLSATTRSSVVNAIGAGARYLEGPVVRKPVAEPNSAFIQGAEDLFRDVAANGNFDYWSIA